MDTDFKRSVRGKTIQQLRRDYPGEAGCHRAILARRKSHGALVSPELLSLRDFLMVLGPRPNKDWTVDRIDVNDPEYAPGKIRWADKRQQANNRTNTILLNVRREIKTLTDWARRTGQNPNTIRQRLRRGASHEEAVYPQKRYRGQRTPNNGEIVVEGEALWPAPLVPQNWEPHYKRWVEAFRGSQGLPLTRRVFALWIESNRVASLTTYLSDKYPEHFSADACPDEEGNSYAGDPLYENFLLHDGVRRQLLSEATPDERRFWRNTLSSHRPVQPKDAPSVAKELMEPRY